jgi:hypothetical protein
MQDSLGTVWRKNTHIEAVLCWIWIDSFCFSSILFDFIIFQDYPWYIVSYLIIVLRNSLEYFLILATHVHV